MPIMVKMVISLSLKRETSLEQCNMNIEGESLQWHHHAGDSENDKV